MLLHSKIFYPFLLEDCQSLLLILFHIFYVSFKIQPEFIIIIIIMDNNDEKKKSSQFSIFAYKWMNLKLNHWLLTFLLSVLLWTVFLFFFFFVQNIFYIVKCRVTMFVHCYLLHTSEKDQVWYCPFDWA